MFENEFFIISNIVVVILLIIDKYSHFFRGVNHLRRYINRKRFYTGCFNIETIVVIGIGGSSLGSKAIYNFIKPVKLLKRKLYFFETLESLLIPKYKCMNHKKTPLAPNKLINKKFKN